MKLVDKSITEFSEVLASKAPAPGGGSTAALGGALGAALIGMVAALTDGHKTFDKGGPFIKYAMKQADELRTSMLDIIDRDTEAFNMVTAVFKMPKNTDEEKADRKKAMQNALKACTITPFELMECVYSTMELADEMIGNYNTNAASDLGVAVVNLKAAAQGAWLNILINLEGISDEIFCAKYLITGSDLLQAICELADDIYADILQGLIPNKS